MDTCSCWSSIIVSSGLMCLWLYDPLILLKAKAFIKRKIINSGLNAINMYAEYKKSNKNEMIKDGYHVDYVYLYVEDPISLDSLTTNTEYSSKVIRYDVTSYFRGEILKNSFSDNMNFEDFVNLCCNPNSNLRGMDPNKIYRLEVNYTFDYKTYKVIFDNVYNQSIKFPLYSETELRQKQCDEGILSATVQESDETGEEQDVTEELRQLAGPLGNFYKDHNLRIKKEWIPSVRNTCTIKIIDGTGDFKHINPTQTFICI